MAAHDRTPALGACCAVCSVAMQAFRYTASRSFQPARPTCARRAPGPAGGAPPPPPYGPPGSPAARTSAAALAGRRRRGRCAAPAGNAKMYRLKCILLTSSECVCPCSPKPHSPWITCGLAAETQILVARAWVQSGFSDMYGAKVGDPVAAWGLTLASERRSAWGGRAGGMRCSVRLPVASWARAGERRPRT